MMQLMSVPVILFRMSQVILHPDLEWRKRQTTLQVLHDGHGQLEAIARLEVDDSSLQQSLHERLKVRCSDERDEMRNLIDAIRLVARAQLIVGEIGSGTPTTWRNLRGVAREQIAEP